jgi:NADH dehydrogenase FAD-containing subunit
MGNHLVLVGGGHAHLTVLLHLSDYVQRGHRVTLVGPSPYHYYSGMGPGMLSGIYPPEEVRFHVKKMAEDRGGIFIEDRVIRIDPVKKVLHLQSGKRLNYDVVSFNTGSEVPAKSLFSAPRENIVPVKPVFNLLESRRSILTGLKEKAMSFVVIGGGPAGLEVTANLWRLVSEDQGRAKITLVAGSQLLGSFPKRVRELALRSLTARGITVLEGKHGKEMTRQGISLTDGSALPFDFAFVALGVQASRLFRDSGIPTGPDDGLLVNSYLQSVVHPEMFGGGDCISFAERPLAKVGVYAVRQNPVLFPNLLAALEGKELKTFVPQGEYMLIFNLGNGRGILWKKNFIWEGRLAFLLKDYIDRKFMRRFQVSGEREEIE